MSSLVGRARSSAFLLLSAVACAVNCSRTAHDGPGIEQPPQSAGAPQSEPPDIPSGGASAAGSSGTSGSQPLSSGAPSIQVGDDGRPCQPEDVPGQPCDTARCWGNRCGIHFELTCEEEAWDSGSYGTAWELVCPVTSGSIFGIDAIEEGACCGETLSRNDVYTEPQSCSLCPDAAPRDGDPCSLPSDCAPPIIDCFYKCCCYGNLTWAQCDGTEWHVATNCSDK